MALDTAVHIWQYNGNDLATVFPFTDLVLLESDLRVTLTADATGVDTVQAINTHYTVQSTGVATGGTVTMLTAPRGDENPEGGEMLTIERIVAITQLSVLRNATTYFPNVVEDALDKLTMGLQQVDSAANRSIKLSAIDAKAVAYTVTIPKPAADQFLKWDSAGTALINVSAVTSPSFTVTTFAKDNLLDETTAAAILANIGGDNPELIDDYSTNAAEQDTQTDPYASEAQVLPTTLAGEVATLRYQVAQLSGRAKWYESVVGSTRTKRHNMVANGSFEGWDTVGVGPSGGWVDQGTPTLAQDRTNEYRSGCALKITAGAATSGTRWTINANALAASSFYYASVMAKATSGDTATFVVGTSGGTDISETTTSTTYVRLSGIFKTDATPTAVTIDLEGLANTDIVWFDDLEVYPLVETDTASRGQVISYQQSGVAGTARTIVTPVTASLGAAEPATSAAFDFDAAGTRTDFDQLVVIPGSGYYLEVVAKFSADQITAASDHQYFLTESIDGGSFLIRDVGVRHFVGAIVKHSTTLSYINLNPTPGSEYRYRLRWISSVSTGTPQGDNGSPATSNASSLMVRATPYG